MNCIAQSNKKNQKRFSTYHNNKIYTTINAYYSFRNIGYERHVVKGLSLTGEYHAFRLNKNNELTNSNTVERYSILSAVGEAIGAAISSALDGSGQLPDPPYQLKNEYNQKGYKLAFGTRLYLKELLQQNRNFNPGGISFDLIIEPQFYYTEYDADLEIIDVDVFWEGLRRYRSIDIEIEETRVSSTSATLYFGSILRFKERFSIEGMMGAGQMFGSNRRNAISPHNFVYSNETNDVFDVKIRLGFMF